MHWPPAVSYPVVRSRWHFFAIAALAVLGLAGALAFALQQGGVRSLLSCACTVILTGCAVRGWRRTAAGYLRWDGQRWHWLLRAPAADADAGALRNVDVVFDFQQVILVRLTSQLGPHGWAWLARGGDPLHWPALRRALVGSARRQAEGGTAADPSPAKGL